jgi:uncharacterized protein (DUF1697 family)
MAKYVALLRAVNVGKRKVGMADLRALCEELGYDDVRTYVNSGNVVFSAPGAAKGIEGALECGLQRHCGFDVPTVVRSAAQWSKLAAANPFPRESNAAAPQQVQLFVSKGTVPARAAAAVQGLTKGGETVKLAGGAIWISYPKGVGQSKLTATAIDTAIGHASTGRNVRTVVALDEMLRR